MIDTIRSLLKTADIIAGAIAVLLAIPSLEVQTPWAIERLILVSLVIASLLIGWRLARNRYWMVKIFLYAGVMMLSMFLARIAFFALVNAA